MRKELQLTFICLCTLACKAQSQKTSGAGSLVAQPVSDRTICYSVSDAGVPKPVAFGLDLAWLSETNVRRGISFMGRPQVKMIRSSFTPTDSLADGELKPKEMGILRQRLNIIHKWLGPTAIVLNDDHPGVSRWFKNADGTGNYARWSQLIDITARHHQEQGDTIITVAPFNEPDYSATGQGNIIDFYNIARELKNNPRFKNVRICGGNTLSPDSALAWYSYLKTWLDEGNTHQLAGSFDNYANFFQQVRKDGKHATGDELHNVMEAMVGAEYGMQTGIWWFTAELARGEFCKASNGVRLGYSEHRPNWTAASVYRSPDGRVQAFGGTSERQAVATSYRFVSRDKDVYYDGYGPQREYTMFLPGGDGYQKGQTNAERVVNITWGEDIQPVIKGRYILVNRSSGKVMEVAGGDVKAGAGLRAGNYSGATYQQWNVLPVPSTIGGDFSYFTLTAVHSGKAADISGYSIENGGAADAWDSTASSNQQWFFNYRGDGWFYIRNRESAKCLQISPGRDHIDQWDTTGAADQQWRLLPVDAAIEFKAPAAPRGLKASANAESVTLSWAANREPDLAGYTIFRADAPGGAYNTIARKVTTTVFVDNTATAGASYYYKIKAVDKSLNSSVYTRTVSAKPNGSKSLVSHWPFDGNTNDSSVNLNHCATYGAVSWIPGKTGSAAIQLDGKGSFIQLPATIANHKDMTIATWIYWKGGTAGQRIVDFGNDSSQYLYLTPDAGSGTLRFAIKNGAGEQRLNAMPIATGAWTHIAITLGAGGACLYVNGALAAQSGSVTIRPADFKPVLNYIGRSRYGGASFNGALDDFRVYNYALPPIAIAGLSASIY